MQYLDRIMAISQHHHRDDDKKVPLAPHGDDASGSGPIECDAICTHLRRITGCGTQNG